MDHLARWISNQVRLKCKKVNRKGRLSKDRMRSSAALLRQLVKLVLCRDLVQALELCSLHPTLLTDAYHATPTELYYILCYIHGFDGFDKNIAKKYFAAIKNTIMIDESNADAKGGGERFGMSSLLSDDILQLNNAIVIIYMAYMAKVKDLVRGGIYPLNKQLMERAATHTRQRYCWMGNPGEMPSDITHLGEFGLGRELAQEISLPLLISTCCVVSSSSSINTESASTVNNLDINFWSQADSEGPVERRTGPSGVDNNLYSDLLDSESDEELNKDLSVYAELSLEEKLAKLVCADNKCGESMEVDPTGSAHNNVDTEEFIGDETTNTSTMDSDKKISWAQPLEQVLNPVTNGSNPITRDEPMNNNITSDALLEPLAQPDLLDMIDSPTADMKEVHQCFQRDEGDSAVIDIDIDEEFVMLFGTGTVHNATDNDQEPEETMATATITNAANNTTVLSRYTSSPVASIKCVSSQAAFIRDDNDNSVSPEDSSIASLHVFTDKESITPGFGRTVIDKGIDDDSGSLEDSSFASLQVLTGKESITRGFGNDNGVDAVLHMMNKTVKVKARGTKTDGANNTLESTSATSYPFSWISSDDVGKSRVGNGSPSPGDLQARWNQRNSLLFKPIPDVQTEPSLTPPSPTCLSPAHQGSDFIVCTYKEMKLMIPAIYGLCRLSKGIMNPSPTIEQLPASGSMFRACVTDEKSEHVDVAKQASDASKSRSLLLLARVAVNGEKEGESTIVPHCSFGGNMSVDVDESRSAPAANSTGTSITSGKRGTKRSSIVLDEAEELTGQLECKLTVEEQATIRCAVNGGGSQTEILARQGTNSVQRGSMETLQPGKKINDEVINYFLKTCLAKSDEMLCSKQSGRKRSHFFNSFFVQTMFNEKNKDPKLQGIYCYHNVRRWGQEVPGKDIFNLKKIVVPVNIVNKHWACMVIFMEEKKIQYFDSLGITDRDKLKGLLQYLKDEYESTKKGKFDALEWELVDCSLDIPRQLNGKYLQ